MTAWQLAPALALVLALPVELAFAQRSHGGRGVGHRGGGSAVPRGSSRAAARRLLGCGPVGPAGRASAQEASAGRVAAAWQSCGTLEPERAEGATGDSYGTAAVIIALLQAVLWLSATLRQLLPSLLSPLRSTGVGPTTPAAGRITRRGRTTPPGRPTRAGYYADGYYERPHRSSRDAYPPNDYADDAAPAPYSYDDRSRDPAPAPRGGRGPAIVLPGESGQLRLEVRPEDTSVYVDDEFRGAAADARQLTLAPGRHTIELVRPGYGIERHQVDIVKGERTDLLVELRRP